MENGFAQHIPSSWIRVDIFNLDIQHSDPFSHWWCGKVNVGAAWIYPYVLERRSPLMYWWFQVIDYAKLCEYECFIKSNECIAESTLYWWTPGHNAKLSLYLITTDACFRPTDGQFGLRKKMHLIKFPILSSRIKRHFDNPTCRFVCT